MASGGSSANGRSEAEAKAALEVVAKAEAAGIRTVQLQFVDLHGITKKIGRAHV